MPPPPSLIRTRGLPLARFTSWRHAWAPALIAYGLMLGLVIWLFRCPPLADFNEWAYQAFITRHLVEGTGGMPFYLRDYPVPYITSQVVMTVFNEVMSPSAAGRLTVSLYLLLAAWIAHRFVLAHRLRSAVAYPALVICIVCNASFWSGYLNYQLGLLVLMGYLSLPDVQRRQPAVVALMSLMAFACHGFCLLAFGVIAASHAWYGSWRERVGFVLAMLPAAFFTLWYLVAKSNDAMPPLHDAVASGDLRFAAYKLYTLGKAGPYHNFMVGEQTDLTRWPVWFAIGCTANLLVALWILRLQYLALWRPAVSRMVDGWGAPARERRTLRLAAGLLGLAYLMMPATAMQIVNPGERLLYPQLLLVFAMTLRREARDGARIRVSVTEATRETAAGALAVCISMGSVAALSVSTAHQGYLPVGRDAFDSSQHSYAERLYWHRPYQLIAMHTHMQARYAEHRAPDMPITFTTSLIGMRGGSPAASQAGR